MARTPLRLLAVAGAAAAAVCLVAPPALAHVSVSSPGAVQGGYGVVTFRVPTESATASTTALKVQLPADSPLAYVAVQPRPGWTYRVTRAQLPTPAKDDDGTEVTGSVAGAYAVGGVGLAAGLTALGLVLSRRRGTGS